MEAPWIGNAPDLMDLDDEPCDCGEPKEEGAEMCRDCYADEAADRAYEMSCGY